MSNDSSVTVASRTPLMMGMRDRYTCGRQRGDKPAGARGKPQLPLVTHLRDRNYFGKCCVL
jgi:hypothetical protein